MSATKRAVWRDRPLGAIAPLAKLAASVQEARLNRDMTQEELAQRTDVSVRTIRRIESCVRLPDDLTITRLARILQDGPQEWMGLLREAKAIVRKAGGLDAFSDDTSGVEV